ncbi:D-alanyl-lipoteichoic acid acyltransferase DltB, MBOAT superfamily [Xylanibacter ruminicola]|uniref:D-alanyl-lipoteichoic acid acyltransferase DltB, MBOAT superfamily n=1 Tax=Xylanibacter ruminicola TaxID=839 RepID=A0A1H4DKE3_XYLRU|nr:MBOAT family O-acyltransferase [Xylanibacter ruminicola]SEA73184.1 D-alanyl-lipoteichoic acid acyltransferase DltB, MBOAT superfamily [Xylanibacter ruminicola]
MLFNSIEFLLFLPIVFTLYWGVFGRNLRWQNAFIVLASYVFYGWWDWRFLILIAFTSFCSWSSGLLIDRTNNDGKIRLAKFFLWSNIVINLLILGAFKYYNFFVQSFVDLFASFGVMLHSSTLKLILPVGISFYTFQALSYSIDVYKKKIEATRDAVAFFAYVSFFPQLVAGPIERATNLLPQILRPRVFKYDEAVDGCRQILWGFFKKVLIADNCAVYVDMVFPDYINYSASTLLFGALMFTFQIYGDFSGYSDIAIGTAKLFGIRLKRNFNVPYLSRNVAEFWKRWHISLNTWFVDYLYIPLGGGRNGKWKKIRNTIIIFLTSGLWHGANWTYVVWGAYHALLFVPLILTGDNKKFTGVVAEGKKFPSLKEVLQIGTTFILVVIGWIIFRASDIHQAIGYIIRLFDSSMLSIPFDFLTLIKLLIFCTLLAVIEWFQREKEHGLDISIKSPILRFLIYFLVFFITIAGAGNPATFIYFQF